MYREHNTWTHPPTDQLTSGRPVVFRNGTVLKMDDRGVIDDGGGIVMQVAPPATKSHD